jgi:hypothetical protein
MPQGGTATSNGTLVDVYVRPAPDCSEAVWSSTWQRLRWTLEGIVLCRSGSMAGGKVWTVPLIAMVAERSGRSCRTIERIPRPAGTPGREVVALDRRAGLRGLLTGSRRD